MSSTNFPVPANSGLVAVPAINDIAATMSTDLDACINLQSVLIDLRKRLSAKYDDVAKTLAPKIAAGGNGTTDSILQQLGDGTKPLDDMQRQIDGLRKVGERLWQDFTDKAGSVPSVASVLLLAKIRTLDQAIKAQRADLDHVRDYREKLQAELDKIGPTIDPGAVETAKALMPQAAGTPAAGKKKVGA